MTTTDKTKPPAADPLEAARQRIRAQDGKRRERIQAAAQALADGKPTDLAGFNQQDLDEVASVRATVLARRENAARVDQLVSLLPGLRAEINRTGARVEAAEAQRAEAQRELEEASADSSRLSYDLFAAEQELRKLAGHLFEDLDAAERATAQALEEFKRTHARTADVLGGQQARERIERELEAHAAGNQSPYSKTVQAALQSRLNYMSRTGPEAAKDEIARAVTAYSVALEHENMARAALAKPVRGPAPVVTSYQRDGFAQIGA